MFFLRLFFFLLRFAFSPFTLQQLERSDSEIDDEKSCASDTTKPEQILITHILATDVLCGLRRLPAGFFVVVEVDGKTVKTSNNSVTVNKDVVEWTDEILLPSELSSIISFKVYASFESGPRLGNGELLREVQVSVGEVLDRDGRSEPFFFPISMDEAFPSCSSLRIITERRICDTGECIPKIDLSEPDAIIRLEELTDEGHRALLRYRRCQNRLELEQAIMCFERAQDICPSDFPNRSSVIFNLANAKFIRYQVNNCYKTNNHVHDLDVPISLYQDALQLRSSGHPDYAATALDLSFALLARFKKHGDEADRTEAKGLLAKAAELSPVESPGYQAVCFAQQMAEVSVVMRVVESGISQGQNTNPEGLMQMARAILPNVSHSDPRRPELLAGLGGLLYHRFEETGDLADLYEAIPMLEDAIQFFPDGHPEKPMWTHRLATSLTKRFQRLGNLADLEKSISVFEEAVHLAPEGHPERRSLLNNLGNSLIIRFEKLGQLVDMDRSIVAFEEVLHDIPDILPDKPATLNNLGTSLIHRYQRLGDLGDLNKSISVTEQAIDLIPNTYPMKLHFLNNLGSYLSSRFDHLRNPTDLDKAISTLKEATCLAPDGHPDKPAVLNNIGRALSSRFHLLYNITDIDQSILVREEAVRLTSKGHPEMPVRLGNLGESLSTRFEWFGNPADMDKSIMMLEEAVSIVPDVHLSKPALLNDLGTALSRRLGRFDDIRPTPDNHPMMLALLNDLVHSSSRRFERPCDLLDIDKSILMTEEAVRLTSNRHPQKSVWLFNLGLSFIMRFEHLHNPLDVSTAVLHFSSASHSPTASNSLRFRAARHYISSARLEGNSQTILEAYTIAMDLLPRLAWLGLSLTERHHTLLEATGVVQDGAANAIEADFIDMAVEWLEQGRSVVWGQFLQLRTPMDQLRDRYPVLAREMEQISTELERASSRPSGPSGRLMNVFIHSGRSIEQQVQQHHGLALRRERLLVEIRSLPDFDRFMLPKTIEQLLPLADLGPVVYLNASIHRCDALIVSEELGSVVAVPLPGIDNRKVTSLRRVLGLLLEQNRLIISDDDISSLISLDDRLLSQQFLESFLSRDVSGDRVDRAVKVKPQRVAGYSPDDLFRRILTHLWNEVVNPVLQALGFSTPPANGRLTRIFWCPTGPFTFLPIHAAGVYGTDGSGPKLSDFAISSYVPTLSALTPSSKKTLDSNNPIRLVTVPQPPEDGQGPLPSVDEEISHIKTICAKSRFITTEDSDGTVEDVMAKMAKADWVHFACHGIQDPHHPLDSGLCLANHRRLKLSDIIQLSRPQGGLAFLSACLTARGNEYLSDESIHLAAGMLLAGYGGVIATMWSIMDHDASRVAKNVYEHLFREDKVPDTREAAEALHYAVGRLRDSGAPFLSWVPFIHMGR